MGVNDEKEAREMPALKYCLFLSTGLLFLQTDNLNAQEARRRWDRLNQIRQEKFDLILPQVMRENKIDMWITMSKEGHLDPLYVDLGQGYVSSTGYYIFTDRDGDRIERAALGISGYMLEQSGAYDLIEGNFDLKKFVEERNPQRIGVNMSHEIGGADGLSHTGYEHIVRTLGKPWSERIVSAEKLISDFRSRRVASEIVAFGEACEMARNIAERAFSNEIITPEVTTLEDVAWWMQEQLLENGLQSSFGMPSVYITGPDGIAAVSTDRIIRRGDLLMIDWGVGYLNFFTDVKRIAYVLKQGESAPPPGIRNAFEQALKVRPIVKNSIKPGKSAKENLAVIHRNLEAAGFAIMKEFNKPTDIPETEVIVGCHSVGNLGHGIGPSIAWFNPKRFAFMIHPTNLLSIEFFAYTAADEWGGKKVRIPLEDDAIVTERGVEWLYPVIQRILIIK
jgi:Xaa-Pro aminopeptidase